MNYKISLALLSLPLILSACATPQPRQTFHKTDNTALVIESLDARTCQMVQPTISAREANDKLLANALSLQQHQTAVVILENYTEPQLGQQFRDRSTTWFSGLRGLGYEHIVFLQGNGMNNPEGLPTIVTYN